MSAPHPSIPKEPAQRLESRKYDFLVDGTMPVLNFEITSGGKAQGASALNRIESQKLSLELYTPLSGELFEARTPKGRIEVDNDGTITYFSQTMESVSFSLFVGKSVIVTMSRKTGEVLIKTPSRIVSIEDRRSTRRTGKEPSNATSDEVKLVLE